MVLHHVENSGTCREGDLLLMDFGAEVNNYSSDCTRTIPVGGRFSERQKELYDAVYRIFIQARSLMVPCTARAPMLPPGNSTGCTTKLSVVNSRGAAQAPSVAPRAITTRVHALRMAEESYRDLRGKFVHEVDSRIPLIIYNSFQDFEQNNITPRYHRWIHRKVYRLLRSSKN